MAAIPWPNPSDSRKSLREKDGRTRIVIPLHTKPRDYVPGSGPETTPLRLLPPRDSTAYILDRILLASSGLAADGKPLPKRMAYLVGWYDLPAARMFVPAMEVLEYVSPRALEEWEWQMELDLDQERAELKKAATQNLPQKKKRGRPPAHSQIEAAVVAEPELEVNGGAWPKMGMMSLTTPTKPRLADFEELSDEEGSPSRQLRREMMDGSMDVDSNEVAEEIDMVDYLVDSEGFQDEMQVNSLNHERWGDETWENPAQNKRGKGSLMAPPTDSFASSAVTSTTSSPKLSTAVAITNGKDNVSVIPSAFKNTSAFDTRLGGSHVSQGRSSFTPAGGTPPVPTSGLKIPSLLVGAPPGPPAKTPASKRKVQKSTQNPKKENTPKSKPLLPSNHEAEPVWEVKRLEDMEVYDVEGRGLVKYFKVRWEGDWPPEQNPSWEPEDNLPAKLVRNYLKRGKKKAAPPPKKKAMKQTTLAWANGKQYRSVIEAFAGDADNLGLTGPEMDHTEEAGHGDEDEEFFVVAEEEQPRVRPSWNAANGNAAGRGLGGFAKS